MLDNLAMQFLNQYLPVAILAFTGFITPGPNNIIIATTSVNFGLGKAMPVIMGVVIGFFVMLVLIVFGLGNVLVRFPAVHETFHYASFALILYLAFKLGTADINDEGRNSAPPTFLQMCSFQWINPKAWALAAVAVSFISEEGGLISQSLAIVLIFLAISFPSQMTWGYAGAKLGNYFREDKLRLRIFNVSMAVLMVASFLPIFWH